MTTSSPPQAESQTSEQLAANLLNLTSSLESCGEQCTSPAESPPTKSWFECERPMVLDAWCHITGHHHAFQTRCNQWTCSGCGPLRTRQLCRRLATGLPNRFITLTCGSPQGRNPETVWNETRRQVPELIRTIRKEAGPIEYARVLEVHKSGYPHFHLIARGPWIDQAQLARWWVKLTDAYIVDIRAVRPKDNVAQYLGKYLTKQLVVPFTNRRCTASKGYFPAPPEKDESGLGLIQPKRENGTLEGYLAHQYPNATWEMITPHHAIQVFSDCDHLGIEISDDGSF